MADCNIISYPFTDPACGDGANALLGKILQRLKETAGGDVSIGDVSLTASDIEIGAVELKDGTTDTRAKIRTSDPDAADPGLVVRNIPSGTQAVSGTFFQATQPVSGSVSVTNFPAVQSVIIVGSSTNALNQFAENAAVVSTTESTVVSYVAITNGFITGVVATGTAAGRFKLKVNGVVKLIVRTTAAKTTEVVNFSEGMVPFSIGDTLLLTGYHEEIANQALAGNILGLKS